MLYWEPAKNHFAREPFATGDMHRYEEIDTVPAVECECFVQLRTDADTIAIRREAVRFGNCGKRGTIHRRSSCRGFLAAGLADRAAGAGAGRAGIRRECEPHPDG